MNNDSFVAYVGVPEIHDGVITHVAHHGQKIVVAIQAQSGGVIEIAFDEVVSVESKRPEGMRLYALSEMKYPTHRLFVFVNNDDDDSAYLKVLAGEYRVK